MGRFPLFLKDKTNRRVLTGLSAALLLSFVMTRFDLSLMEAKLYDARIYFGSHATHRNDIELVVIDDSTVNRLDEFAPLNIHTHAQFLKAIQSLTPKAVGYLVDMNLVSQNDPSALEPEWSDGFVKNADRLIQNGIPFLMGTHFDVTGEVLPPYPISSLPHALSVIYEDGHTFAGDQVTRRALLRLEQRPTFHLALAQATGLSPTDGSLHGEFTNPQIDTSYFYFRYHDSGNFGDDAYPIVSFSDVLEEKPEARILKNKIILVTTLLKENPHDFSRTPLVKSNFSYPRALVHANILNSIIEDDGIAPTPAGLNWMISFLVIALTLYFSLRFSPTIGLFVTLLTTIALLLLGQVAFQGAGGRYGYWLNLSVPLLGILVCYYLIVPFRLFREHKKRADYQNKNEILIQVEQLKSNFLSLVTHDLKTPVARIQGLAELLKSRVFSKMDPDEREVINHILQSTEDLNQFITRILELAKIESDRIQLHLESKDINRLAEEVITSLRPNAKLKNIDIETHFEPLFPVKVDPALMKEVIHNVIENAIKYSPEGSSVIVSTWEEGENVKIETRDFGLGMSPEEQASLFTKFYRAKNEETANIAGTGLGLYLAKYFIDCHQGSIEVHSGRHEGSAFTIAIPQDLTEERLGKNPGLTNTKKWELALRPEGEANA